MVTAAARQSFLAVDQQLVGIVGLAVLHNGFHGVALGGLDARAQSDHLIAEGEPGLLALQIGIVGLEVLTDGGVVFHACGGAAHPVAVVGLDAEACQILCHMVGGDARQTQRVHGGPVALVVLSLVAVVQLQHTVGLIPALQVLAVAALGGAVAAGEHAYAQRKAIALHDRLIHGAVDLGVHFRVQRNALVGHDVLHLHQRGNGLQAVVIAGGIVGNAQHSLGLGEGEQLIPVLLRRTVHQTDEGIHGVAAGGDVAAVEAGNAAALHHVKDAAVGIQGPVAVQNPLVNNVRVHIGAGPGSVVGQHADLGHRAQLLHAVRATVGKVAVLLEGAVLIEALAAGHVDGEGGGVLGGQTDALLIIADGRAQGCHQAGIRQVGAGLLIVGAPDIHDLRGVLVEMAQVTL